MVRWYETSVLCYVEVVLSVSLSLGCTNILEPIIIVVGHKNLSLLLFPLFIIVWVNYSTDKTGRFHKIGNTYAS